MSECASPEFSEVAAQLIQSRAATLRSRPWEIDERRLADEYDAAQERGGIARLSVGHLDQRDGRKEQPAHEDVVDHVGRCFDLPCLRSAPSEEKGRPTLPEPPLCVCIASSWIVYG